MPSGLIHFLRKGILIIVLLAICAALSIMTPYFLSVGNFLNILRNSSMQGIIAAAMTLVIISGEIDLSVGSVVAFSGCLTAWIVGALTGSPYDMGESLNVLVAAAASLAAGLLVGLFTGWVRVAFKVPTFIITLAWMSILRGCCLLITQGFSIISFPPWYNFLGGGYLFGDIPFPAVILVIVFALFHFIAKYTAYGRSVYAIGGNQEAARLSGICVRGLTLIVLASVTVMGCVAGVMQSSQIMAGSPNTATGWEMDVIAAVIIGGTSLAGGVGSVLGTFIGVIFLGVVMNGMTLLDMNEYWQYVARGVLIFGAVLINMAPAKKN
jgi:ribose/xylose/arabinose/galactoside ABC-type transport system permease subunit